MSACSGFEGVAPGILDQLLGTYTGVNTVRIDPGAAIVDGKMYLNDAAVNVNIPNAGAGTVRKDRIVLRCSWAGFTVTLTVLTGSAVDYPLLTQTTGVTYDIALYKAEVTDAGVVTLVDERTMASQFKARQGGSATVWSTPGTTNYRLTNLQIQCGSGTATILNGNHAVAVAITFPIAFSNKALVLATISSQTLVDEAVDIVAYTDNTTIFTISLIRDGTLVNNVIVFNWIAIGPV
ncbi:MAG: hypothetical protein A2Y53_04920 [Chloroflexi bacterium RBG_16_47_49]|nr:MAG: hypothetical protein A2Y53_04920 [Chloroflexi bacterium RBG_16_47_49]